MKIKLNVGRASQQGPQQPGDVIDLDDREAMRLVDTGQAERVGKTEPERRQPHKARD